eukprot:COSAG06_NODE_4852_length_3906_cov_4.946677_1_plen_263_part_00
MLPRPRSESLARRARESARLRTATVTCRGHRGSRLPSGNASLCCGAMRRAVCVLAVACGVDAQFLPGAPMRNGPSCTPHTWDAQAAQGNYGTTQAGSANTCFTEQSDILYLNPLVAGKWLTLSGTFIAPSSQAVARIHTDSAAVAYVARVSVQEVPDVIMNPRLWRNGHTHNKRASSGENGCVSNCVVAGVVAGDWSLHGMNIDWMDMAGKQEVAYLTDAGMLSDLFQPFQTIPGNEYRVEYEVHVPTDADVFDCRVPKTAA